MRDYLQTIAVATALAASSTHGYYATYPYAPAAGQPGSTAMYMTTNAFVSWASGYTNLQYGTDVDDVWKTPEKALGPAVGGSYDIVCLGNGGRITLTFPSGISNGAGFDFAVFENGVSDTFLELGWVEVSSDGTNFVRFPNYSLTSGSVGAYGSVYPERIFGLAGKYRQDYGTPFDLQELQTAYNDALVGHTDFDAAFTAQLTNGFPKLDLDHVTHVRIVDVVGDGSAHDARGLPIYDPYPTTGSGGFDLDALGVVHEATVNSPVVPSLSIASADAFITMAYAFDRAAWTNDRVEQSVDLAGWSNAVPGVVGQETNGTMVSCTIRFPADAANRFYRLRIEHR